MKNIDPDKLEYRTCCDHTDCTTCAGHGGFYRLTDPIMPIVYSNSTWLPSLSIVMRGRASDRELLSSAIQHAIVLAKVGMEFGAKLCIIESTTIKGEDYIRRDSVMGEVAAWRTAFDNAPKIDSAAVRAALAIPASTAPARDAEGN